jgi:hypothetical protein
MNRRAVALAIAVGATLATAGCAGTAADGSPGADSPPGFGHVHGLGLNPADDRVYAATHYGVFRLDPDGPRRIADRLQDTMGFTIAGADLFLGSGHPDPREGGPRHLGLISSTDRARTWETVALRGEVDFHALTAAGNTIYGWDSTSGSVLRSDDGGATWQRGAEAAVADLDVDPADPSRVVTTSEDGLLASQDGGVTFDPVATQPPETLVFVDHVDGRDGDLAGVDTGGGVWTFVAGRWMEQGSLSGQPQAFTAASPSMFLAATETGVHASGDGGRTWQLLAAADG